MTWVMFWIAVTSTGVSSGSQEFTSKSKCDSAAEAYNMVSDPRFSLIGKAWCKNK